MSDLSNSAVFPLGQENTRYAQYFIGRSYLNMAALSFCRISEAMTQPDLMER